MSKLMRLPARLLRRKPDSHKGDYGKILVLAGSRRFSGAALLCAEAALRAGAGLVTAGVSESTVPAVLKNKSREVMVLPLPENKDGSLSGAGFLKIKEFLKNCDLLIMGPGLGPNRLTWALARRIVKEIKLPMVLDADALNALSGHLEILKTRKQETILTPHPKEMSVLFGLKPEDVKKKRKLIAKNCAKHYNSIIILKGHHSIVTDGGSKPYINMTGNPGMATAGSGDVLCGMVAALLGQGLDAFNAAKFGVYLHGLAGDIAAKDKTQMGMIASDIIDHIPDAIKKSS